MIKYTILLFNLMGLFLYQLFFQANVNVSQNVPASADAGTSFNIEVTINKADVSGFAKYEEDLPAGCTAEAVEKQGATVLSSGSAIKFIWASLPSQASFKITIKVTIDASVSGTQNFSGKFLYVVNNERQEADAPAAAVTINGKSQPAAVTETQPAAVTQTEPAAVTQTQPAAVTTQATDTANKTVASTPTPTVAPTPTVTPTPAAPAINITRSYSSPSVAQAADETVTLTIHKGSLSGFAKLEETIPNGLVVGEGDKQGASFTFADGKAKFVWLNLPTDSVFTVTYKLSVGSTVSGDQSVAGEFSYLIDNNAQTYTVPATSFSVQAAAQPVATNTETQPAAVTQTQPAAVTETQPAAVTQTEPAAVTQTEPAATTQTSTQEIPAASGSVNYRVQIMALHNPVKASYLSKHFGITEAIKEEMLEGYTKYTVGSFTEYKSVRDHREEVKSKGVQGPFVVAYNAGKRITVQEALMITKQQWFQ